MLNSLTTTCTRFTKVPCFCPECMGTTADRPSAQPSGERFTHLNHATCPNCGGTEHVDPLPGTVGLRCVKCCDAMPAPSPDVGELVQDTYRSLKNHGRAENWKVVNQFHRVLALCRRESDAVKIVKLLNDADDHERLAAENAKLRAALAFYADPDTWEDHGYENGLYWVAEHAIYEDSGKVARAALGQKEQK